MGCEVARARKRKGHHRSDAEQLVGHSTCLRATKKCPERCRSVFFVSDDAPNHAIYGDAPASRHLRKQLETWLGRRRSDRAAGHGDGKELQTPSCPIRTRPSEVLSNLINEVAPIFFPLPNAEANSRHLQRQQRHIAAMIHPARRCNPWSLDFETDCTGPQLGDLLQPHTCLPLANGTAGKPSEGGILLVTKSRLVTPDMIGLAATSMLADGQMTWSQKLPAATGAFEWTEFLQAMQRV